jgi:riboflavin kinase / FMN adenylyltransferase
MMASPLHLEARPPFPVDQMPAALGGGVIAVGNFDGVHRGHQALLAAGRARATDRRAPALVLTFEPHPRTVLRPNPPVFRLTPLAAKARVLMAAGLDGVAVAKFDRAFAAMTPDEFIERVLVGHLKIAEAVVGFNFRFGRARAGDAGTLRAAAARLGFAVTIVEAVAQAGALIASSDIRSALTVGNVMRANALLGYRWFVNGTIEHGEARGRALGFPTANLRLADDCTLRHGVYAVRLRRRGGAIHDGVASYGVRPTFGGKATLLEVHLFDFEQSLYGDEVAVTFIDWIRPEEKFAEVPDLIAAIRRDCDSARTILAAAGPGTDLDGRLAQID